MLNALQMESVTAQRNKELTKKKSHNLVEQRRKDFTLLKGGITCDQPCGYFSLSFKQEYDQKPVASNCKGCARNNGEGVSLPGRPEGGGHS